ncbi:phosphoadenosine phosphosulfate reductase [Primorskyibacter sp. S187A]|uniref:phosphoadenosine phosphosulfate reductase n=1 Tax=Primorskyibacter sp. S187A TaxID=3415130 RepID=UPI003C798A6E
MQDLHDSFDLSMTDLNRADWTDALQGLARQHGFFERLGARHIAAHIKGNTTLVVTFESRQGIQALSDNGQPLGFELVKANGWSHLALVSEGDTWFRDGSVYGFFDRLTDEGFFDTFDDVLFYGAGPCGYAACAFSVAAPGALVLAIQPQATLEPRVSGWDERFIDFRMLDFTTRYGYAPDMIDAAQHAYILFDPRQALDAMHAALFRASNVTMLRAPFLGAALQSSLLDMALFFRILTRAGTRTLTPHWFYAMLRTRRNYPPYLRALMTELERDDRQELLETLCVNVTSRMKAPRFRRKLEELRAAQ